jgi:hypothetical protein
MSHPIYIIERSHIFKSEGQNKVDVVSPLPCSAHDPVRTGSTRYRYINSRLYEGYSHRRMAVPCLLYLLHRYHPAHMTLPGAPILKVYCVQ